MCCELHFHTKDSTPTLRLPSTSEHTEIMKEITRRIKTLRQSNFKSANRRIFDKDYYLKLLLTHYHGNVRVDVIAYVCLCLYMREREADRHPQLTLQVNSLCQVRWYHMVFGDQQSLSTDRFCYFPYCLLFITGRSSFCLFWISGGKRLLMEKLKCVSSLLLLMTASLFVTFAYSVDRVSSLPPSFGQRFEL